MKHDVFTVSSVKEAWELADSLFPTDYEKDDSSSERAGYPIYRSTAEGHWYDYICDLCARLEVNLSNGDTYNIYIVEPKEVVQLREEVKSLKVKNKVLEDTIEKLQKELSDAVDGWEPFECKQNVSNADYRSLAESAAKNGVARYMSEEEAIAFVGKEYGFRTSDIKIITEIDEEEVNRKGSVRKTGRKIDRRPIFGSSDWYYVRFDVLGYSYEGHDYELTSFVS